MVHNHPTALGSTHTLVPCDPQQTLEGERWLELLVYKFHTPVRSCRFFRAVVMSLNEVRPFLSRRRFGSSCAPTCPLLLCEVAKSWRQKKRKRKASYARLDAFCAGGIAALDRAGYKPLQTEIAP